MAIQGCKIKVKIVQNEQIIQKRRHHAAPCQLLFDPIAMRNACVSKVPLVPHTSGSCVPRYNNKVHRSESV